MYQDKNGIRYYNDFSSSDGGTGIAKEQTNKNDDKIQYNTNYFVVDASD